VAIAVSGAINTAILKKALERDRPSLLAWASPQEDFFHGSFPSGHTATSFGIAWMVFLFAAGGRRALVGWLALAWASLVGYSRVYRGVHWPTDVVGAAFVGIGAASIAYIALVWRAPGQSQSGGAPGKTGDQADPSTSAVTGARSE
jgi:undecaprenyl-diphosphatase